MNLPDLTDTKPWWQSRTQVAILAGAISVVGSMFGIVIDANVLTELAVNAVTLVSLFLAARARVTATQQISTKQVLPGLTLPKRK